MSDFWMAAAFAFVITGGPFALIAVSLDFLAEVIDAVRWRFWPPKPEPWPEPISVDELIGMRRTIRKFTDGFID